jgi:hypothetical protein
MVRYVTTTKDENKKNLCISSMHDVQGNEEWPKECTPLKRAEQMRSAGADYVVRIELQIS